MTKNDDGIEVLDFDSMHDFLNYILNMGFQERLEAVFPIEPEHISGFRVGIPFMSIDGRRHVTAVVEPFSRITWEESEQAWIARVRFIITRIDSRPPKLRSV